MASRPVARPAGLPPGLAALERTLVMGVLNVTPDSFSDGGLFATTADAIAHGRRLHEAGADLIDVGGESTRPGAQRVAAEDEGQRVLPVIEALAREGIPVSIDTMRAATAQAAVAAGACIVNDVSGGLGDPAMLSAIAELEVPCVLMHWRGHSEHMDSFAHYDDVLGDVTDALALRRDAAVSHGVRADRIALDPGLGFAKDAGHNWALLAGLATLQGVGQPLVVGASRKRFLGALLATPEGIARPVGERDAATDAVSALAALQGVWAVRVHDVRASADAVRVAQAWREAQSEGNVE